MTSGITPIVAASWTMTCAIALPALSDLEGRAIFVLALVTIVTAAVRSGEVIWRVVKWTLPFALPLVLIHGVINPLYHPTSYIMGFIPLREAGVTFGLSVSVNLLAITTLATAWWHVDRDLLVDDLSRISLPIWLIMIATQSIAVMYLVRMRVQNVYLAQRARGIPVGPGLIARLKALPSVIVPVVISTLSEADARSVALASRGFGAARVLPVSRRSFDRGEVFWSMSVLIVAVVTFLFRYK